MSDIAQQSLKGKLLQIARMYLRIIHVKHFSDSDTSPNFSAVGGEGNDGMVSVCKILREWTQKRLLIHNMHWIQLVHISRVKLCSMQDAKYSL